MRPMGKITFAHIEDGEGRIQLFFRPTISGRNSWTFSTASLTWAISFRPAVRCSARARVKSPCVWNRSKCWRKPSPHLPAAKDEVVDGEIVRHALLADPETRYRQRYADLAVNPDVRQIFQTRAAIVTSLRNFLDGQGFLEVETPILQPIYTVGQPPRPFITHHNQLHQDLYLRISFELYLKRLLVGGIERVYEIGRDFRNEGVSFKHNPEFTQLEFYWAYADYLKVMEMTEQMLAFVCDRVLGQRKVTYNGHELSFEIPWPRLELRQGLIKYLRNRYCRLSNCA